MWAELAAAGVAVAGVGVGVGWLAVRLRAARRALAAERAARRLTDAAWGREMDAIEHDIAEFVAVVRGVVEGRRAQEAALAEAGAVVDRAWARHEQEREAGGGSDG